MVKIWVEKLITIVGLPTAQIRQLAESLTFLNPEYINKVKRREDLKETKKHIKLFKYSNETQVLQIPRGHFEYLLNLLKQHRIQYELTFLTGKQEVVYPKHSVILRPYQVKPVEDVITKFKSSPSFILESSAGSGKTVLALYIANRMNQKTLWLTDRGILFNQAKDRIREFLNIPEEDIGELVGTNWTIGKQITIGMIPTLYNRDLTELSKEFGLVIVDECVLVPTKRCYKVLTNLAPTYTLGLTALAKRGDNLTDALFAIIGKVGIKIAPSGIIYPLVVTRPTNRTFIFKERIHNTRKFLFDRAVARDGLRNKLIVDDIALNNDKFTTIILGKLIPHI